MSSIDRISFLPVGVLCRILSFLPTKISISTSVLAKRWRYLWAHVPNIDFDSQHHKKGGTSFSDIIYRVMLMYKVQNMTTFCLSYKDPCGEYQLETCVATAIVRNVKNLYLELGNQVRLPRRIFTCKTLVDLRLCGCGNIPPASSAIYLPALKNLHLDRVGYASDQSLAHLLYGCPVLEELMILRHTVDPLVCCYVSSPTLTRLILFTCFANDGSYTVTYSVKIDTPALRYLGLLDTVSKDLSCGPLTSLVTADVHFHNCAPVEGDDVRYSRSVLQLVGSFSNVKDLMFSTSWLEVTQYAFSELTMKFQNLTSLTFYGDWRFISRFLENADNIEVLTIHMVNNDLNCNWMPRLVSSCVMSRLRWVKIDQFRCTMHEFNMIRYLLRNAKVLKRMEIHSQHNATDSKTNSDALKSIASFRRGSEACELVYH